MTDLPTTQRRLLLSHRPEGLVRAEDFVLDQGPVPEPADGEALMRTVYLAMDVAVRTWLSRGEGYMPAVEIGEVVRGAGVGPVVASRTDAYAVGDLVYSLPGWQEYAIVRDDGFTTLLDPATPLRSSLGVFGTNGAAAYFGLLEVGKPRPGETVVVSAAAGATGSLVGQIAKIQGCRVVGITGSDEKCAWLTDELGFDGAVNYRTADLVGELKRLCPDRIDVYFDNVGGTILDAALRCLAMHGRVVLCGALASEATGGRPPGPANYVNLISRRGTMAGFINFDYWDRFSECFLQLREWAAEGLLRWREEVVEGIEHCPDALNMLFTGENRGKIVVQVSPEPK